MSDSDRSDVNDLFAGSGEESSSNEDFAAVKTHQQTAIPKRAVATAPIGMASSPALNAMYSPQEEENELQDAEPLIKPESSSAALKQPDATTKATLSSKDSSKKSNSCGSGLCICGFILAGVCAVVSVGILGIVLKPAMNKFETQLAGDSHHRDPPAFLRTPINKSGLAHHNQSKVHGRRNHSAGGKRMRGNNTAARSPFNGHGGRVLRQRDGSEHPHRHWNAKWSIVHEYPHDKTAFTEGLEFHNGHLYESTGLYRKSELRIVDVQTGKVLKRFKEPYKFGEGCTILNNTVYRLTWRSHKGYMHDAQTLERIKEFDIPPTTNYEGWGISHIGNTLVMDDGSTELFFIDPVTMQGGIVIKKSNKIRDRRVRVHYPPDINDGQEVDQLNELEYVHGELLANVWYSDFILRINPDTGLVLGIINLTSIVPQSQGIDVMNGIAYNHKDGLLYVTGKFWPSLFAIKVHW